MEVKKFKKLLKEYSDNLHMLIRLHCINKIYLTNFQIEKVLKLRGDRVSKEQY